MAPCVVYEDEHLLVVNKPAGFNTHAPSPYAGEGLYDWLRHREPRWATLAIIHRLDKETSGLLVFSKSTLANRSLTAQFTQRVVRKRYLLLTDRRPSRSEFLARSYLRRAGEKYVSAQTGSVGELAETRFRAVDLPAPRGCVALEAEPLTGRTHQIRVHAAANGFPILGDKLYGGSPAARVCLHAAEISFQHPSTGAQAEFRARADFSGDPVVALRDAVVEREETNSFRLVHAASDGWPGLYVDVLGSALLCQTDAELSDSQRETVVKWGRQLGKTAIYHKRLTRHVRGAAPAQSSPQLVQGDDAPERFTILENGLRFELSFREGYSVGLFLDQRDNRRRLVTGHIAAGMAAFDAGAPVPSKRPEVLNTFAYTCGFSVCAARAGARTTSLDLSKKYLEWGKRNFVLNGLDPAEHDFIFGDVFDWLKRLTRRGRQFDVVLLDPPTFSQSRERGVFRAEKDYHDLVTAALPVLRRRGVLFASSNAALWPAQELLATVREAIQRSGRSVEDEHYAPQPPDFPVSRQEPAYLKTAWFRVA